MTDKTEKAVKKKRMPIWLLVLSGFVLTLIVLLVAGRIYLGSSAGLSELERRVEALEIRGQKVRLDELKGDLLSSVTLGSLEVSDAEGVWLTAENIQLKWKPEALLSRKLKIDVLGAEKISTLRRPVFTPAEDKPSSSSGNPLKGISLNQLYIRDFLLAEGLMSRQVEGAVDGSLNWAPEKARIDLDVTPSLEDGDLLSAHLGWNEASPLTGKLELNGPAGGLFTTLLRLDPDQALKASFEASGDAESVSGTGKALIDGTPWVSLHILPEGETHSVVANVELIPYPLTRSLASRLGDDVQLESNFSFDDPIESLELVAVTERLRLKLDDIRREKSDISGEITLSADHPHDILQSDAIGLERASLTGRVSKSDDGIGFVGGVRLGEMELPSARLQSVSGNVDALYSDGQLTLQTDLNGSDIRLALGEKPSQIKTAKLGGDLSYNISNKALTISGLDLTTPRSSARARGGAGFSDNISASLKGDISLNLAEFSLLDAGFVTGNFTLEQSKPDTRAFSATLTGNGLGAEGSDIRKWLGDKIRLNTKGRIGQNGNVSVPSIRLYGDNLSFQGSFARKSDGNITLAGDVGVSDTYPLAASLPELSARIDADGKPDNLSLSLKAIASRAGSDRYALQKPEANFDGLYSKAGLTGSLSLTGQLENEPLNVTSRIGYADGIWSLSDLEGLWQDLTLSGHVEGEGGDIAGISGALDLNGGLPQALPGELVTLSATRESGLVDIAGTLEGIDAGPLNGAVLKLNANGSEAAFDYALDLEGSMSMDMIEQALTLDMNGRVSELQTSAPVIGGQLQADLGGEEIASDEPFQIILDQAGYGADISLNLFDGQAKFIVAEGSAAPLNLQLSKVSLSPLMVLLGRAPMEGELNLQFDTLVDETGMTGTLQGGLYDMSVEGRDVDPVSFRVDGQFDADGAEISAVTPDIQLLQGDLKLDLPIGLTPDRPWFRMLDDKTGAFNVLLNGPIDNMSAIFLPEDLVLKGKLDSELTGSIPFVPDSLFGKVNFAQGVFQHEQLGADLQSIGFEVVMENQVLRLDGFAAEGRKGGSLSGKGRLDLNGGLFSTLELDANNLVVVDRREGRAVATGTIGLGVDDDEFKIVGDLTLVDGEFNLDRLPSAGAPTLDVSFENPEEVEEPKAARRLSLDLKVDGPRGLKLTGKGMDAEIALDTAITGTSNDVDVRGDVKIVRGRFELLGKRFTFREGSIDMAGDPMKAALNIIAERDTDDFIARVTITGTPERPKVDLSSEPTLPEDEVLSRVLFGRSPSQLSGLEAARLAAALASMSGGGGFDLMGSLENLAGLDSVDVSQNESGQFEVATGRYISDDVYLEVSSSASGAAGVSVEWEPRSNISVEAESKPDEGQTLAIQWKKDFD